MPMARTARPGRPGRGLNRLDLALLCLGGAVAGYLIIHGHGPVQGWNWKILGPYLLREDGRPGLLLQGLLTTIRLTCWSAGCALIIGIAAGLARTSTNPYPRLMSATFVELCRNTPPLVLIFLCYYFLADQLIPGAGLQNLARHAPAWLQASLEAILGPLGQMDAFLSAALTLGLYEGAYVAEIVRGGILAVPAGQWEAGRALGFPKSTLLRLVILPQAARNTVPPLAGQLISTIKDSAIVSAISIQELTFQGTQIMATTYHTFEIWSCVALLYFLLTFSCSLAATRLEQRLRRAYTI